MFALDCHIVVFVVLVTEDVQREGRRLSDEGTQGRVEGVRQSVVITNSYLFVREPVGVFVLLLACCVCSFLL